MAFVTKIDLARQSRIDLGETAFLNGSMAIGQNFFISGIQIDPTNPIDSYVLTYNAITNSYTSQPQLGATIEENRVFFGMSVSAITNTLYNVSAGIYKINGTFYNFTGNTASIAVQDPTLSRFDLLFTSGGTNNTAINTVYVQQGVSSTSPVIPSPPDGLNDVVVAILSIPSSGNSISIYYPNLIPSSNVTYNNTTLNLYLDAAYSKPLITSFTNSLNELEFGQTASTIVFNWTTNKLGKPIPYTLTPTGETYDRNTYSATFTGQTITGTTANTATTYSIVFDDGFNTTNATTNVKFYNLYYIGTTTGTTVTNANILTFTNTGFAKDNLIPIQYINGSGNYVNILQPTRFPLSNIFVNGMYSNDFTITTINVTNQYGFIEPYYLIQSTNPVYSTNMSFECR